MTGKSVTKIVKANSFIKPSFQLGFFKVSLCHMVIGKWFISGNCENKLCSDCRKSSLPQVASQSITFKKEYELKLLTQEIKKKLPKLYETDNLPNDQKHVVCKFFNPIGYGDWYVLEGEEKDDDFIFFGL